MYLSTEGYCQRLSISDVISIDSLVLTHEEAEFRLMVHANHAINSNSPVIIRSHSGDREIFTWHWHRFIPLIWSSIVTLVQEERYCKCQMLRRRKTTEMQWSVFTSLPVVITPLHFSTKNVEISFPQEVGNNWTANLVLRKWWKDLVKMTQLMMTFEEHLENFFAQCMVVDLRKMSIPFDLTSSLRSRTEKTGMWACQLCRLVEPIWSFTFWVAYLMRRSSVAQAEELPLSDCGWDHEGRIIWIGEARPSAAEGLLGDSHNANESSADNVDEYFGDDCMSDQHYWNASDIFYLEFTWTIFISVWHLRNIIYVTTDLGQTTCLNF